MDLGLKQSEGQYRFTSLMGLIGLMVIFQTMPVLAQSSTEPSSTMASDTVEIAITVYDDKITVIGDTRDVQGKSSQTRMRPFVEGMRQALINPIRTHYVHKESKPFLGTAYGLVKAGRQARFWLETEDGLPPAVRDEILTGFQALKPPVSTGKTDLVIIYFRAWNAPQPEAYPLILPKDWQAFVKNEDQLGRSTTLTKIWPGK